MTTAKEMAIEGGVDPPRFRKALWEEKFPWHDPYDHWTVEIGSEHHEVMRRVLRKLSK